MTQERLPRRTLRQQLYEIIEQAHPGERTSRAVEIFLVTVVLINLAAVILESIPDLHARFDGLFLAIEIFCFVVFSVEYALRLYIAPEHEPNKHLSAFRARLRYAISPLGIIDVLAVVPFWLHVVTPHYPRLVLVLRVLQFLKLARYSRSVQSLLDTVYEERRALGGCMLIVVGLAIISGTLMHAVEGSVQPDKFGTIPDAMWWAIVTLGTIGYGDVVPITAAGKLVASATTIAAVVTLALPVGIIATAFADQIHRRDFIVTWGMVSRVPLFAGLTAGEIADVMRLLRAETREAGDVIARRGDVAHSMYFIARGEVEIQLTDGSRRLNEGHFFGEMAALRRVRRTATVRAMERTSLLVLDARDLHSLMQRQPTIAQRLRKTVQERLGEDLISTEGDLLTDEFSDDRDPPAPAPTKPRHRT
jgi:voltage-gated potassium channel